MLFLFYVNISKLRDYLFGSVELGSNLCSIECNKAPFLSEMSLKL